MWASVAVIVCCLLAVGGWVLFGRGDGGTPQATGSSPAAVSPPVSSAMPSTDTASPGGPPAGYHRLEDDLGFTADIPDGWTRRVTPDTTDGGGQVFFTADNDQHLLQVGVVKNPAGTPYSTFSDMEKQLEQRPGYQLYRLTRLDGDPGGPVEIEFAYDSTTLGRRHVIDRGFVGPDGTFYAVLVAGPDSEWPAPLDTFRTVVGSFCATGYCQSAGPGDAPTDTPTDTSTGTPADALTGSATATPMF